MLLTVDREIITNMGFQKVPGLISVQPTLGPEKGATHVILKGFNFVDTPSLACSFGHLKVRALFETRTRIECTSTVSLPGLIPVTVTNNGVDFSEEKFISSSIHPP